MTVTPPSGELHAYSAAGVRFLVPFGWVPDYRPSRCKGKQRGGSCEAVILWCKTPRGRSAPLNPDGTSHFANCPDAPGFRKLTTSASSSC